MVMEIAQFNEVAILWVCLMVSLEGGQDPSPPLFLRLEMWSGSPVPPAASPKRRVKRSVIEILSQLFVVALVFMVLYLTRYRLPEEDQD